MDAVETVSVAIGSAVWIYFIVAISLRMRSDYKRTEYGSAPSDYPDSNRLRDVEA